MSNLLQTIDEKLKVCDNGNYSQHDYEQALTALRIAVTEIHRMHDCVWTSVAAATAFMGIPDRKRENFITDQMSNADFIRDNCLASIAKTLGVEE